MRLAGLLRQSQLPFTRRALLERALQHPGVWPIDSSLAVLARAMGLSRQSADAGQTLLVSVSAEDPTQGTLWELVGRRDAQPAAVSFGPALAEALREVKAAFWRGLPYALSDRVAAHWQVTDLVSDTAAPETHLDGGSFGLAFALAYASLAMARPFPAHVIALAAVDGAGRLLPVDHLETKLRIVAEEAMGVEEVLVATEQVEQARGLLAQLAPSRPVDVVGARSLPDLYRHLWGAGAALQLQQRVGSVKRLASESAGAIFQLALLGSDVVTDWHPVEAGARALLASIPEQVTALRLERAQAQFALAVAERHLRNEGDLSWPTSETWQQLGFSERLQLMAHALQSATDSASVRLEELLSYALAELKEAAAADGLELRGAVGRALAVLRRYAEAVPHLTAAVAGWRKLQRPDERARPLCELLRATSILGDRAAFERWLEDARLPASPLSRTFLDLALGVGWLQLGEPARALEVLEPESTWRLALRHVQLSRQRHLARALDHVGREADASAVRNRSWSEPGLELFELLSALDLSAHRGEQLDDLVARLTSTPGGLGRLAAFLVQGEPTTAGKAKALINEYPY
jgi:hypothetical protein